MQNTRTLQFWDTFYKEQENQSSDTKEWVLQPTPALLDQILEHFPCTTCTANQTSAPYSALRQIRVLEIGCGSSTLARDLWLRHDTSSSAIPPLHILATDVSPICIQQNEKRDASVVQPNGLEYRVLNVAEEHNELVGQFDVILDKGCLDTFLFRTKHRGSGKLYGQLVRTVLDNIQSWLRGSDKEKVVGVYLAMTPRPKFKSVRDYEGFSSFQRYALDLSKVDKGDLEGTDERIFLYRGQKNLCYDRSCDNAFRVKKKAISDQDLCPGCHVTFLEFRKGEALWGRGEAFWFRSWRGHCAHCRG